MTVSDMLLRGCRQFAFLIWLCHPGPATAQTAQTAGDLLFVDATSVSGIDFLHRNGATGDKNLPETMGSGLAFLDADGDGWLDIYFVNSVGPAEFYQNLKNGAFRDATTAAGLENSGYGMGCAVADFDNDGDADLYITAYGANILYRNDGDTRFANATDTAGVGDAGFGAGATWGDTDLDGDLDLYVANYLEFNPATNPRCARVQDVRVYCGPEAYPPQADVLYRNNGDGTFVDVSSAVGLLPTAAKELGAVFCDYDNDGDADLYVVGDKTPNLLYLNDGGRFAEVGTPAGVAYGDGGASLAGMGIAVGDYDRDGWLDFFVTNFQWESNSLYRNLEMGLFVDVTHSARLGVPSLAKMGWGTSFFDWDNDGDLDLFTANGHMDANFERFDSVKYAQQNQLFTNEGDGRFLEVTSSAGAALKAEQVSRGSAAGDYDNDGDLDLAISNNNEAAVLLRNDRRNTNHWLAIELKGAGPPLSNRDGVGARIEVVSGDLRQIDEVRSGSSYLSQEDPRLFFGLGARQTVDLVRVRWPSGQIQELRQVRADQFLVVQEPGNIDK
jgi:hypothetical protein